MLTVGFKKCCKYRTYSTFGVFRFLLSRGTIVHLPSQENEIQNLSQQPAACRSYFFDTLKGAVKTAPFEFNYLLNHLRFGLFVQDFEPVQLCIAHSLCLRNT